MELALIRLCQLTDEKKKSIIDDELPIPIQTIAVSQKEIVTPATNTVQSRVEVAIHKPVAKPVVNYSGTVLQRPGSISISATNVVSEPQVSQIAKAEAPAVINNKPFSNVELENAWRRFADTIPEQGRLTSFILSNTPHQTSDTEFEVTVSNSLQQKEFIRLQPDIISYLKNQLQNSFIRMTIKVMEEDENQRSNSPEDRYRILVEQNPALKILRDNLNLEID